MTRCQESFLELCHLLLDKIIQFKNIRTHILGIRLTQWILNFVGFASRNREQYSRLYNPYALDSKLLVPAPITLKIRLITT